MSIIRVMRIELSKTGIVEDNKVNTFHFRCPGDDTTPSNATLQVLVDAVDKFFNTATAFPAVRSFIAEQTMASQRSQYKLYNMAHAKPRAPVLTVNGANPTPISTGIGLPSEVALCVSYRGALLSGVPAARRRGRIYIGPILTSAIVADSASLEARPVSDLQNALVQALKRMCNESTAILNTFGTYSPTNAAASPGAPPADSFTPVLTVWCDNAFDTQRRRGVRTTSRVEAAV